MRIPVTDLWVITILWLSYIWNIPSCWVLGCIPATSWWPPDMSVGLQIPYDPINYNINPSWPTYQSTWLWAEWQSIYNHWVMMIYAWLQYVFSRLYIHVFFIQKKNPSSDAKQGCQVSEDFRSKPSAITARRKVSSATRVAQMLSNCFSPTCRRGGTGKEMAENLGHCHEKRPATTRWF
jgi:hypothetical protein